jgi:coenzyme F420-reducing hydrogenase gamma subunit
MQSVGRPRVAFFDFACCEGCQLTVLQLEEKLLEILKHVEVVTWREVMTGESLEYDIAFCEGSITRNEDIDRIKRIRETAKTLVSLGACASIGCHNALKNTRPMEEMLKVVYGSDWSRFDTIPARPISAVVPVDYQIQGCPVSLPEFLTVFKHILTGQTYHPPNQPVCVECKLNDHVCVYEKGLVCLGPVTRCGCNAICTAYGDPCQGCRGFMDEANLGATSMVLSRKQRHSIMDAVAKRICLRAEEMRDKFSIYNNWPDLRLEEISTHGHGRKDQSSSHHKG